MGEAPSSGGDYLLGTADLHGGSMAWYPLGMSCTWFEATSQCRTVSGDKKMRTGQGKFREWDMSTGKDHAMGHEYREEHGTWHSGYGRFRFVLFFFFLAFLMGLLRFFF